MFKISVHYTSKVDSRSVEFSSQEVEHFLVAAIVSDETKLLPKDSWVEVRRV